MFGLVTFKYISLPSSLLNNIGSIVDPSSSLLNFKRVINGVGDTLQLDIFSFLIALAYLECDKNIPPSDC